MAVVADRRIGTELAGYRVEALLGRGGMSVVYRAEHLRLKRKIALKLLAPELAEDERFRQRFLREPELAASLDHPNIVPVYDAGEVEGLLYIAMRYVEGTDLKALLRHERALQPARALALVTQVGEALDAAHERGLIHRDVKPSNVLITGRVGREHCYLADFGLSKTASDRGVPTDEGQTLGTIDYVAPEQIEGGAVDGRADVYSLTCLLYECLVGEVPFKRSSETAVIYAHLEDAPPKASDRRPELPADLDAALAKGMAKAPEDRWESCAALVEAARAALEQGAAAGMPVPAPPLTHVWRRWLPIAAAAAALAGAVLFAFSLLRGGAAVGHADSLVRIDPRSNRATSGVKVGARPVAVAVCAASVVVARLDAAVSEVEPNTSNVAVIPVGGTPADVSDVGALAAVVSGPPSVKVTVIDTAYGGVTAVVPLPGAPSSPPAVASDGTSFWIANPNAHELERIGSPYTSVVEAIPLPIPAGKARKTGYAGIAVGERSVWVAGDDNDHTLWRVDPVRRRVVATIRLPFAPQAVAAGRGGVWVADRRGNEVVRFDPSTNRLVARIRVGRGPTAIAASADSIWVANERDGTVSRIDPRRNSVEKTIAVGSEAVDLAVGLGGVWVIRQTA